MSKICKRKLTFNGWKEHTCTNCGSVFRYPISRKVTGSGYSPMEAEVHAMTLGGTVLAKAVDTHPCPLCGRIQSEMIAIWRARWHRRALWFFIIAQVLPVYLAGWEGVSNGFVIACTEVLIWFVALSMNLLALFWAPGRSRGLEMARARTEIAAGKLVLVEAGSGRVSATGGQALASRHRLPVVLFLAFGGFGLGVAEMVRLNAGWPSNPDWRPEIISPGDTVRISYPYDLASLGGFWSATAWVREAKIDGKALAIEQFRTRSSNQFWGETISRKRGQDPNVICKPWQDLTIPSFPDLAGKKLDLLLQLDLTYPELSGTHYYNQSLMLRLSSSIRLSPPHASSTYSLLSIVGSLTGMLLVIVVSRVLWKKAWKESVANPGRLVSCAVGSTSTSKIPISRG